MTALRSVDPRPSDVSCAHLVNGMRHTAKACKSIVTAARAASSSGYFPIARRFPSAVALPRSFRPRFHPGQPRQTGAGLRAAFDTALQRSPRGNAENATGSLVACNKPAAQKPTSISRLPTRGWPTKTGCIALRDAPWRFPSREARAGIKSESELVLYANAEKAADRARVVERIVASGPIGREVGRGLRIEHVLDRTEDLGVLAELPGRREVRRRERFELAARREVAAAQRGGRACRCRIARACCSSCRGSRRSSQCAMERTPMCPPG